MSDPNNIFARTNVYHISVFACSLALKLVIRFYQKIFTRLNIFSLKSIRKRIQNMQHRLEKHYSYKKDCMLSPCRFLFFVSELVLFCDFCQIKDTIQKICTV